MVKTFKIPVEWSAYATVEIEADSLEEAVAIFDKTEPDIPLPVHSEYIDGSFRRCSAETGDVQDDVEYYRQFN